MKTVRSVSGLFLWPGISPYLRDGSYIKRNRKLISAFKDQMFKYLGLPRGHFIHECLHLKHMFHSLTPSSRYPGGRNHPKMGFLYLGPSNRQQICLNAPYPGFTRSSLTTPGISKTGNWKNILLIYYLYPAFSQDGFQGNVP